MLEGEIEERIGKYTSVIQYSLECVRFQFQI